MRKAVKMVMGVVMAAVLLIGNFGFFGFTSQAADLNQDTENPEVLEAEVIDMGEDAIPYTSLAQCIISISGHDDGMYIDITTGAVGIASVIGVKDIKVERKFWYGWSTVATCSGGEISDRTMMGICITYANAVKDATYRISCVHYADVDGYKESTNDTGAFVYTY